MNAASPFHTPTMAAWSMHTSSSTEDNQHGAEELDIPQLRLSSSSHDLQDAVDEAQHDDEQVHDAFFEAVEASFLSRSRPVCSKTVLVSCLSSRSASPGPLSPLLSDDDWPATTSSSSSTATTNLTDGGASTPPLSTCASSVTSEESAAIASSVLAFDSIKSPYDLPAAPAIEAMPSSASGKHERISLAAAISAMASRSSSASQAGLLLPGTAAHTTPVTSPTVDVSVTSAQSSAALPARSLSTHLPKHPQSPHSAPVSRRHSESDGATPRVRFKQGCVITQVNLTWAAESYDRAPIDVSEGLDMKRCHSIDVDGQNADEDNEVWMGDDDDPDADEDYTEGADQYDRDHQDDEEDGWYSKRFDDDGYERDEDSQTEEEEDEDDDEEDGMSGYSLRRVRSRSYYPKASTTSRERLRPYSSSPSSPRASTSHLDIEDDLSLCRVASRSSTIGASPSSPSHMQSFSSSSPRIIRPAPTRFSSAVSMEGNLEESEQEDDVDADARTIHSTSPAVSTFAPNVQTLPLVPPSSISISIPSSYTVITAAAATGGPATPLAPGTLLSRSPMSFSATEAGLARCPPSPPLASSPSTAAAAAYAYARQAVAKTLILSPSSQLSNKDVESSTASEEESEEESGTISDVQMQESSEEHSTSALVVGDSPAISFARTKLAWHIDTTSATTSIVNGTTQGVTSERSYSFTSSTDTVPTLSPSPSTSRCSSPFPLSPRANQRTGHSDKHDYYLSSASSEPEHDDHITMDTEEDKEKNSMGSSLTDPEDNNSSDSIACWARWMKVAYPCNKRSASPSAGTATTLSSTPVGRRWSGCSSGETSESDGSSHHGKSISSLRMTEISSSSENTSTGATRSQPASSSTAVQPATKKAKKSGLCAMGKWSREQLFECDALGGF